MPSKVGVDSADLEEFLVHVAQAIVDTPQTSVDKMPKRKRDGEEKSGRPAKKNANPRRKLQVEVATAHKQLQRAFKLAKGFERQKLGRRRKTAAHDKNVDQIAKVDAEVEAWKMLEPGLLAAAHLHRLVQREKALRASKVLAELCQTDNKIPTDPASSNISARLLNSNPVKTAISEALASIRATLGIPGQVAKSGAKGKPMREDQRSRQSSEDSEEGNDNDKGRGQLPGPKPDDSEDADSASDDDDVDFRSDEEALVQLADGRIASDSGSEASLDVEALKASSKHRPHRDLSVTPPDSDEEDNEEDKAFHSGGYGSGEDSESASSDVNAQEHSGTDSESDGDDVAGERLTPKAVSRHQETGKNRAADSQFMPTLSMGGYISGSESEASSLEEQLKPRKNRRGQRARQAIWEQKYGKKAKHLQDERNGNGGRDSGWDARKGATGGGVGNPRTREPRRPAWARGREGLATNGHASGGNATAVRPGRKVGSQAASKTRSNDNRPLHPSWEAKIKAKANDKGTAAFAGKKVTFD